MPAEPPQISVYDEVAYPSYPFPLSHPDRLALAARFAGLETPAIEHCRVLELGCGAGGNLLPLAEALPDSQFLGLDRSESQIAQARSVADELRLTNLRFEVQDLLDFDDRLGPFDYIVCHGVFSWTTPAVRDEILSICRRHLAQHGIAYINYNTYPGWQLLGMVRDMIAYAAKPFEEPARRIAEARRAIDQLLRQLQRDESAYAANLRRGLKRAQQYSDAFLFHALLNVVNEPCYLYQFVERAAGAGLQYVGDADPLLGWPAPYTGAGDPNLQPSAGARVQQEQFRDFLQETSSRQSLLCHQKIFLAPPQPTAVLASLYAAARLQPEREASADTASAVFRTADGRTVTTTDPRLRSALLILADAWPECVPWTALEAHAELARNLVPAGSDDWRAGLLQCFVQGIAELHTHPPRCGRNIAAQPRATRFARYQCRSADFVTTLRHRVVRLDRWERNLLSLFDGEHTPAELTERMATLARDDQGSSVVSPPSEQATAVQVTLRRFADQCLILAR